MLNKNIRFNSLDGLRGLLALTVMLSHIYGSITSWAPFRPFSGAYIAVVYFFMLSGFVLSHSHNSSENLIKYALIRLARLWPLHFISSALMAGVYFYNKEMGYYIPANFDQLLSLGIFLKNIAFIHGITPYEFPLLNDPSWSISIEFWGSLLIPMVMMRLNLFLRLFLSISFLFFFCVKSNTGVVNSLYGGLFSFFIAIVSMMIGSSLYSISIKHKDTINRLLSNNPIIPLSLAVCLVGIYTQTHNRIDFFYILAFTPILFTDFLNEKQKVKKLLSSSICIFLGEISFPLYMLHSLVIISVFETRPDGNFYLF